MERLLERLFTFLIFLGLYGKDLRGLGYEDRFNRLSNLIDEFGPAVKVVPLAVGYTQKKALYERLKAGKKEGIVFKRLSAAHRPGKGEDFFKYKFRADVSCRIKEGRKGKRSVGLELLDENGKWVDMGNCTIPPNKEIPKVGMCCDISYLYCYKGGHIYQPVYKGPRDDVDESECVMTQLKYKAEED
jgi:bifunctional non-homologous end joining protein LigD